MGSDEERTQLARRVEKGVLGVFANERATFLDLMDEQSVLISAGSKVFHGRESFEVWPPNPPGVAASNVVFSSPYTAQPDEAIVIGTYLLRGPCIQGVVNQRVTVSLRRADGDWKITLAHFSNEWPQYMPAGGGDATEPGAGRRLQLRSEGGLVFVDPEEIVYAESAGKRSVVHLTDRTVTVGTLLGELFEALPDQFMRVGRFYVVNVRFVQGVGRDGIVFSGGDTIPVPERRVKEIQLEIASAVTRNFG